MLKQPLGVCRDSDVFYEVLYWISPLVNPNVGKIEPPVRVRRPGLIAYANNTDWNPGSGEGLYLYTSGGTWAKL